MNKIIKLATQITECKFGDQTYGTLPSGKRIFSEEAQEYFNKKVDGLLNSNTITKEDVYTIANKLKLTITDDQIRMVLELYEGEAEQDPSANWSQVVENLIYSL